MTEDKFISKLEMCGLDNIFKYQSDNTNKEPLTLGVYGNDGHYTMFSVDQEGSYTEQTCVNENEAFNKLYDKAFEILEEAGIIDKEHITIEVAKMPKNDVIGFICKEYTISREEAEECWDYLKKNIKVLFEYKYYVYHKAFVPSERCYMIDGFTAEKLWSDTTLEILNCFNFLIRYEDAPDHAMEIYKRNKKIGE